MGEAQGRINEQGQVINSSQPDSLAPSSPPGSLTGSPPVSAQSAPTAGEEDGATAEELKLQIDATRAHMDRLLAEFSERLHPKHFLHYANLWWQDHQRKTSDDGSVGQGASHQLVSQLSSRFLHESGRLGRHLRARPLASSLLAGGMLLLWFDPDQQAMVGRGRQLTSKLWGRKRQQLAQGSEHLSQGLTHSKEQLHEGWEHGREQVRKSLDEGKEQLRQGFEQGKEQIKHGLEEGKEQLKEGLQQGKAQLQHGLEQGKEHWQHTRQLLRQKSSQLTRQVVGGSQSFGRRQVHVYTQRSKAVLNDSPLGVAGVMLGLGIAVGILLPRSRREDAILGRSASAVKDQAAQIARASVEAGVQGATQAAKSELRNTQAAS